MSNVPNASSQCGLRQGVAYIANAHLFRCVRVCARLVCVHDGCAKLVLWIMVRVAARTEILLRIYRLVVAHVVVPPSLRHCMSVRAQGGVPSRALGCMRDKDVACL